LHDKLGRVKKVYITGGTMDTLRDDARLLKRILDESGWVSLDNEASHLLTVRQGPQ